MSWVAVAVGGGALLGGIIQGSAAENAAGQASAASNRATDAQLQMFNTTNQQSAPWRQQGQNALNLIGSGFGLNPDGSQAMTGGTSAYRAPTYDDILNYNLKVGNQPGDAQVQWGQIQNGEMGSNEDIYNRYKAGGYEFPNAITTTGGTPTGGQFTHQFGPQDLQTNLAPNYAWQLGQGLGALQNSQAGTSGLVSGNAMRGLNDYAQNFAGNAYQNAFNNYNTQQTNIFNRLSTIAGLGSASANNSANVGAQTGAGVANSMIGAGQAQAAGTVGMGNALSGGLNNAAGSWYGMNYLNKLQSGGSPMNTWTPEGLAMSQLPVQG